MQFLVMDTENVDSQFSLGVDFLTNLASCQTLTEWFLRRNISVAPLTASNFSMLEFDSLTYLSFISKKQTSIAKYTPLLCAGYFPSLEWMEVCLTVDHTLGQSLSPAKLWKDFFKYLCTPTVDSLLVIEVMIKRPTACQVSFDNVPDLQIFNLESFEINIFHSLSASNLLAMFAYWPDLIILHISGMDIVTIDFSSLVEIASRFPYFEELEIQINCTAFPSINDVPVLQHNLETLKFSLLHLENHIALAHCIDKIFPDLMVLYIYGSPPFLKSGVGKEIQEIYQGLQLARKDHDQRKRDQVSISSTFH